MSGRSFKGWKLCSLVGGLLLAGAVAATPASAQGQGLPRTYQVQRVDTTIPFIAAGIGYPLIAIGDVNRDGKDDLAASQTSGSPNDDGVLYIISGANGQLLDSLNAPDSGGTGNRSVIDRFMDKLTDIGSCPGAPAPTAANRTCPAATIGPPDGIDEIMIGAEGVDAGGVVDVGRVWVIDGATRSLLKRIDMPPADRALVQARQAANPGSGLRGGFGRTVLNPRGLPPCAGNGGLGACLSNTDVPPAVRIGDMDGGGQPDIVVGANAFPEIPATANPASHCATSTVALCGAAGRAYVYRGEEIFGSNPAVILDGSGPGQTPPKIIRSLAAQADEASTSENFGHTQMPVGDVGICRTGGAFPNVAPGERCPRTSSTNTPDGRPEFVVAAHRADYPLDNPQPGNIEVGASFLIDGATGSVLHTYVHPEPQASAFFGYSLHQTFALGNLGSTLLPDLVIPAMGQNSFGRFGAGRAYVINGNYKTTDINPALLNDPTPSVGAYFGVPTEGVGDLVPSRAGNEVVTGAFGFNAGRREAFTDVHFFSPWNEEVLQTISDPDVQSESGFGYAIVPLGDLNGDGFLDLAVGAPRWNAPGASAGAQGIVDQGRIYVFRSDNSPAPAAVGPPAGAPAPPPGAGTPAVTVAGRTITLRAGKARVARRGATSLTGEVASVSDAAGCAAGQTVTLQRKPAAGGSYRTFATARSSAAGRFSKRIKPTRSYRYRARVSASARCMAATSADVAVRVASGRRR